MSIDRKAYLRTYDKYEKVALEILGDWRIDLDAHLRGYFHYVSEEYNL